MQDNDDKSIYDLVIGYQNGDGAKDEVIAELQEEANKLKDSLRELKFKLETLLAIIVTSIFCFVTDSGDYLLVVSFVIWTIISAKRHGIEELDEGINLFVKVWHQIKGSKK